MPAKPEGMPGESELAPQVWLLSTATGNREGMRLRQQHLGHSQRGSARAGAGEEEEEDDAGGAAQH